MLRMLWIGIFAQLLCSRHLQFDVVSQALGSISEHNSGANHKDISTAKKKEEKAKESADQKKYLCDWPFVITLSCILKIFSMVSVPSNVSMK